jgi:hypothetical protein
MLENAMPAAEIAYFDRPGKKNTEELMDAVSLCLKRSGIKTIIIASNSGDTAMKAINRWSDSCSNLVVVTSHAGFSGEGLLDMDSSTEAKIAQSGAKLVRASHVLSGVERSFTKKFGGVSRVEVVSETLRTLFGQGMKVCVEITVMAADSGAITCGDDEVIVIGGTGEGADTACVVRPAHANDFLKFEIREIIAMPRHKRAGRQE